MTELVPSLAMPGKLERCGWQLPEQLNFEDWLACGQLLNRIEGSVQWWRGDWWAYGSNRKYGDGEEIAAKADLDYGTVRNYASVARAFELSRRRDNLSFSHHAQVMDAAPEERDRWLDRADREKWSVSQLRAAIKQGAAFQRTKEIDLDAAKLGKFVLLYADPPWRYDLPPMGDSGRSIENQYPTMALEEICALPVRDLIYDDAILFLWTTSPLFAQAVKVLDAWGFDYRTNMVWVKDKIGMGYYVRQRHETLVIAKRGKIPTPAVDARPDSVVEAPRLEHSAKPPVFYDLIDRMYPGVRKLELFARNSREGWFSWGNQVDAA